MMLPNDQRNFVHKRIGRAVTGFVAGGPTGAIGGFAAGGRRRGGRRGGQPVSLAALPGSGRRFAKDCPPGKIRGPGGGCRTPRPGVLGRAQRALPGGASGFEAAGAAVMGQYGAALEPFIEDRSVRSCLPGMVLGKDGLCYNRRDISNKEREYPRGTRPLGTPGELAALRKAASFGRRMETTVKRMQKIGVLKKPGRRAAARVPAAHLISPPHA